MAKIRINVVATANKDQFTEGIFMNKTITITLLNLSLSMSVAHAAPMNSATFTAYASDGAVADPPADINVTGTIGSGSWNVASTTPFFGASWTAHSGTTFGPGTYTIDTVEGGAYTNIVVGPGQIGGHILFDWGPSLNNDIVNVWDVNTVGGITTYTSTDIDGDGTPGIGSIDGSTASVGLSINYDFTTAVPIPPAIWLFGSGLLGLISIIRRKQLA